MSDIVLVSVGGLGRVQIAESNGIAYIASYMRKFNYECDIIDPTIDGLDVDEIISQIVQKKYKIVGLSVLDSISAVTIAKKVKSLLPESCLVIGGHTISIGLHKKDSYYFELLQIVDYAIVGDGEITFKLFLDSYFNNNIDKSLTGLAYWEDGNIIVNPLRSPVEDLDSLPFQARDTYERYINKYDFPIVASMISSRGCHHNVCTFCSIKEYSEITCKHVRTRSISNIISEINYLQKRYGTKEILFDDDDFIINTESGKKRIKEFYNAVLDNKINIIFNIECRVTDVMFEEFELLTEIGLKTIYLGVESFYDDTLKFYGKGYKYENIEKAIFSLNKLGFSCAVGSPLRLYCGLILWHPKLNIDELEVTLECIRKFDMPVKSFQNKLEIYKNTALGEYARKKGYKLDHTNKYEWTYDNPDMILFETKINNFISTIMNFRDKIRFLEKTKSKVISNKLVDFRKELDELCFSFVQQIISDYKNNKEFIEEKYYNKFDQIKEIIESENNITDIPYEIRRS